MPASRRPGSHRRAPRVDCVKHDSTIRDSLEVLSWKVLTVQRTVAGRWWNYRNVVSPFSRLWLVVDGRATVRHHGREFKLERGALHLVPAFTAHDCACPRRLDHYHLHFSARLPTGIDLFSLLDCAWQIAAPPGHGQWLRRLEAVYPKRRLPCFNPFDEEYRNLPASLDQADARTPAEDWLKAQGLLRLLLSPFLATARAHTGVHAQVTQRFLAVQEYIHEHMDGPITLTNLARVADLHPTYFSDRFRHLVGVRPLDYLMQRRLERAQYLLLTTQHSVKEVSFAVGIHDPAYFTRVFVKHYGISPTQYRTSHRV
jgi:AraC-like DNA-binding protein